MAETGIVLSIAHGIARIELPRKPVCGKCGLCMMLPGKASMHMLAYAPEGTKQGDRVCVEVDRSLRWRAQLWLLAVPLAGFIGCAVIAKTALDASDGMAALAACAGLAAGFGAAVLVDRLKGLSSQPVARIVAESAD